MPATRAMLTTRAAFAALALALIFAGCQAQRPAFRSALPIATASPAPAPSPLPSTVPYKSFEGAQLKLYPWVGARVALLTPDLTCAPTTIQTLLGTLDRAYDFYADATGRLPQPHLQYSGRTSIASVAKTCGAGCGYLGFTGIELMHSVFNSLCKQVKASGVYDQAVFYELGRNFWFYGEQLEYKLGDDTGAITTGYAVGMRFLAMDTAGAVGAAFGEHSFNKFRGEILSLVDRLRADPALTWANTLKVGKAPGGGTISLGGTDLFASIFLRLHRVHGPEWIRAVWQKAALRPKAATTQAAVDNFVVAASQAAAVDLAPIFVGLWKFPVSEAVRTQLAGEFAVAEPDRYLGIDFDRACKQQNGPEWTATLESKTAKGWRCVHPSEAPRAIQTAAACAEQVPGSKSSSYLRLSDPRSWYCRAN